MPREELSERAQEILNFWHTRSDRTATYSIVQSAIANKGIQEVGSQKEIIDAAFERVAKLEQSREKKFDGDDLMAAINVAVKLVASEMNPEKGSNPDRTN